MTRLMLASSLIFISSQTYAADTWFDSALEVFGFGEDKEVAAPAPESTPEPKSEELVNVATSALKSGAMTSNLTNMIASQLGVTETQAKGGLGSLFGLAKSSLGSQEFSQLSSVIPDMDTLLSAAPAISEEAAGLTSLMGNAGKYGKALQDATQAYSQFKELGVGVDQIPQYIAVTNEYLESQGNDDAMALLQKGLSALNAEE